MQTSIKVLGILAIVLVAAVPSAPADTQEEVVQRTVPAAGVSMLRVSTANGGGPLLKLRTTNGGITIEKARMASTAGGDPERGRLGGDRD